MGITWCRSIRARLPLPGSVAAAERRLLPESARPVTPDADAGIVGRRRDAAAGAWYDSPTGRPRPGDRDRRVAAAHRVAESHAWKSVSVRDFFADLLGVRFGLDPSRDALMFARRRGTPESPMPSVPRQPALPGAVTHGIHALFRQAAIFRGNAASARRRRRPALSGSLLAGHRPPACCARPADSQATATPASTPRPNSDNCSQTPGFRVIAPLHICTSRRDSLAASSRP